MIIIEITDNGQSIPADKIHLVFQKFGQVTAKSSGGVRSTGLGMTFCKRAIEAHGEGSEIGIESEVGKGTTVWFKIPSAGISETVAVKKEAAKAEELTLDEEVLAFLRPYHGRGAGQFVDFPTVGRTRQVNRQHHRAVLPKTPHRENKDHRRQLYVRRRHPRSRQGQPGKYGRSGAGDARFLQAWNAEKADKGVTVWDLRLGIHTGPVMAGVVGEDKFAYDIWGDTVNTASRMESSGETSAINISEATCHLVKHRFHCTYRGEVQAKNKGMMGMYFVSVTN